MHKELTKKYHTGKNDHTVQEVINAAKSVYLTQKLLGNTFFEEQYFWDHKVSAQRSRTIECIKFPESEKHTFMLRDPGKFAQQLKTLPANAFQAIVTVHWKGYLPRINKAMATRMLKAYKARLTETRIMQANRERPENPDQSRITSNQALETIKDRLYPLTFDQYTEFAEHVYVKRGSPKYYKKEITGVRFGVPRTYRERSSYAYPVQRYVGVQVVRNDTGHLSVKMSIINEKIHGLFAGDYMR